MEIASLIVRIGADMADLVSESKKATQVMSGMASTINAIGGAMLAQFGAQAVTAIASMVRGIVDWASALTNLSQQTGINTTALQEFEYAGKATGVTIQQITQGIDTMLVKLSKGNPSAIAAVRELRLEVGMLTQASPDEQLYQIADAFEAITDPADRARLSSQLFGEMGPKLLPLIENLRDLTKEARDLGLVLGPDQVKNLTDLGKSWDQLAISGKVLVAEVIGPFVPMARDLTSALLQAEVPLKHMIDGVNFLIAHPAAALSLSAPLSFDYTAVRDAIVAQRELDAAVLKTTQDNVALNASFAAIDHSHDGMTKMTDAMRKNSDFAKAWADEGKRIEQHLKTISDLADRLSGKTLITQAADFAAALRKIGTDAPMVASEMQKGADVTKAALDQLTKDGQTTTEQFRQLTAAYREFAGLTKEGLLPSKAGGSTAGALGILPNADLGAGDPFLRETNSLVQTLGQSSEAVATQYNAMGEMIKEGNYTIIDSTRSAAQAVDGMAQSWRGAAGAVGGYKAALGEAFNWAEAGGGFVYDTGSQASVDILNRMNDAILSTKYGAAWKGAGSMRGFAGGTDGYEYFGGGTPAMLHGWEKVTPKGQGGGDGATVVTVNMSGMLLSNSPAAREEVRRFINDTVASGIKRSRKFSY